MSPSLSFEWLALSQNNANELLQSASVREALVSHRHEMWVCEISEASLTMLDLCGTTKDILLLMKSHLQLLRSKNRRQCLIAASKKENAAPNLTKLKKEISKCLRSLRCVKKKPAAADIATACRDSMVVVVGMLRDVRLACIAVLDAIFSLVSASLDEGSSSRGSVRSLLLCGRCKIMSEEAAVVMADKRVELEALGMGGEEVEDELECTFRRLIQTRVYLLNILTSN
uniref:Uncharacterized protein n=1 Tax=Kalanchoe fedtschenkoi TaxID=63787 RepID=A0A7N0URE9_KALFE